MTVEHNIIKIYTNELYIIAFNQKNGKDTVYIVVHVDNFLIVRKYERKKKDRNWQNWILCKIKLMYYDENISDKNRNYNQGYKIIYE